MTKKIIIIGAGIVGATTAYELARSGVDVVIIDSHEEGRATFASAGMISPWLTKRRNKAWYELARKGAAYVETLIQQLSMDGENKTGYKKVGALRLHTNKEYLQQLKEIALHRRGAAPQIGRISLLSKEETAEFFPLLNKEYHSLFIEGAARVNGRALSQALVSAAKKYGAEYIVDEAELVFRHDQVYGVQAEDEFIESDFVIALNGVWMPKLLKPLNVKLNITAQKGEIIHLKTETIDTSALPMIMPPNNQYILNFDDGKIVIGATHKTVKKFEQQISVAGIHYILDEALKVAPGLAHCSITEFRTGFRPFTFNHLPVFGSVPHIKGLLIANGLGASGLTTGPFIGKQLARIIKREKLDVELKSYTVTQALID